MFASDIEMDRQTLTSNTLKEIADFTGYDGKKICSGGEKQREFDKLFCIILIKSSSVMHRIRQLQMYYVIN